MRWSLLAALGLIPLPVHAEGTTVHHDHRIVESARKSGEAQFKITINPEARVSVVMSGSLPRLVTCGIPIQLPIKIINQSFVTSRLDAHIVGDVPTGATLEFHPEPLTGVREESRELRVTLAKPGMTDLTVAFQAHNESPDLGGRDRVHFLLRCT